MQNSEPNLTVLALAERTPRGRILSLDSLRGLAAFVVIWHHFRLSFVSAEPRWFLKPLFAGHAAVVLFFVLSGYVLAIPYWAGKLGPYRIYLIRRFFRIYLPYAVAVFFAAFLARYFLHSKLPLTEWFHRNWDSPITSGVILKQLLEMAISPKINWAFWSLSYEIEFSLIFPVLCAAVGILGWRRGMVLGLMMLAVGSYLELHVATESPVIVRLIGTVLYMPCFMFGALLAKYRAEISNKYSRMPTGLKWIALALAAVCFYAGHSTSTELFLIPIGACAAILLAMNSSARSVLETPVPEYLGRISFSLYLTHMPVLLVMLNLFFGKVSIAVLAVIYGVAALIVAHLFCVTVEEPSMRAGKTISARMLRSKTEEAMARGGVGGTTWQ